MTGSAARGLRVAMLLVVLACTITWAVIAAGPYVDVSLQDVALFLPLISVAVVGALITLRRPEAPLGWLFLLIGVLVAANAAGSAVCSVVAATGTRGWWVTVAAAVVGVTWPLTFALLTSFLVLLFPDGPPSRRWRPVAVVAALACLATGVASLAAPTFPLTTSDGARVDNPVSWLSGATSDAVMGTSLLVCLVVGITALVALILRVRRADDVLRLQLRWVTAALLLVILSLLVPGWAPGVSSSFNPYAVAALTLMFVSVGVAITRYHLYDIDRVISRTASYAIVTGLVLAVYAGIVISASRLLGRQSPVVVAVATLVAAAIARPALRRVQTVVDRRFNRSRYDARLVVEGYGHQLRSRSHMYHVAEGLVGAVNETVAPSSVALWVRP